MTDRYLDLEALLEQKELLEPDPEQEAILKDSYGLEIDEKYLIDPELLENGMRELHELPTEIPEDQYYFEKQRLSKPKNPIYRDEP